jgi:hypothetical protein
MDIQLIGTIVRVLPLQKGTKRDGGEWQKQEYLLSVEDERYDNKVCFQIFGAEKIAIIGLKENERVRVHLEIRANEYNGKFYNSIDCWKVDRNSDGQQGNAVVNASPQATPTQQQPAQEPVAQSSQQQQFPPQVNSQGEPQQQDAPQAKTDDLPF